MGLALGRLARSLARFIGTRAVVSAKAVLARSNGGAREELLPAVFVPVILLPDQYNDLLRRKRLLRGEKLLMFAVLEDAVENYMRHLNSPTRKGQNRFREAEEWINRRNRLGLFSFDNVCEALDIDPDYMREGLHRWKESHLKPAEQPSAP